MPVIVAPGDKLIMRGGSVSSLSRPSVPLALFGGGGSVGISGGTVSFQDLYETQVWVYTTVNKISHQIARLPLKVYQRRADGEREQVRDHPLALLLRQPQPRRSPLWFKQKASKPVLVQGNALFVKVLEQGRGSAVDGLLPLDWRYITPLQTESGELAGWKTDQTKGDPRYFLPESVVHFAWDSGAGDVGVSPLKALGRTLRIEDSSQRYQASSFENGVRHSAVYSLPDGVDMDEADKEELRKAIQTQQGGVDKAFGLALATGGGTITPLSHTAVEAELIEQRKLNREEVAAAYDIPPPLIGILDHATYSNVAEMHRMLYGMVLGPWLTMIEETIKAQLIDTYQPWADEDLFVEFDLAEVLKGDTAKEIAAIRDGIATGILTPNEGRAIRNLPPSDQAGMDEFYLPTNNLNPVGEEPEPAPEAFAAPEDPEQASIVRRHLDRAADMARDKGYINFTRLAAEMGQDLRSKEDARIWADRIKQAGPQPHAIRALIAQ